MYECFNCLKRGVIWDSDYDYEDLGYEGRGVVHVCHCVYCGAFIEYRCPAEPAGVVGLEDEVD